jgi:hypothetical protein
MRFGLTTIFFPCPGCARELPFARGEARDGAITATCDRCVATYVMTPTGVYRAGRDHPDGNQEN